MTPTTYARAVSDLALIVAAMGAPGDLAVPERALAIAREGDDQGLLLRALIACGYTAAFTADVARAYLDEAAGLARESGDKWRLSQILWCRAYTAIHDGDPRAAIAAGEEGRDLADEVGDRLISDGYVVSGGSARHTCFEVILPKRLRSSAQSSPRPAPTMTCCCRPPVSAIWDTHRRGWATRPALEPPRQPRSKRQPSSEAVSKGLRTPRWRLPHLRQAMSRPRRWPRRWPRIG